MTEPRDKVWQFKHDEPKGRSRIFYVVWGDFDELESVYWLPAGLYFEMRPDLGTVKRDEVLLAAVLGSGSPSTKHMYVVERDWLHKRGRRLSPSEYEEHGVVFSADDGSMSQKLLPHVKQLIKAKKDGDAAGIKEHEGHINAIAGPKTIPASFTDEEKKNPEKLAKVISCISSVKEKDSGVNPYAVCRESVMGAPKKCYVRGCSNEAEWKCKYCKRPCCDEHQFGCHSCLESMCERCVTEEYNHFGDEELWCKECR
jgi:hypothetical protein